MNLWNLSAKGGNVDEMLLFFGEPGAVQIRKPTDEDRKKVRKLQEERDKKRYKGLIAIAQGSGVKVKTVSRQQFFKEIEDVR